MTHPLTPRQLLLLGWAPFLFVLMLLSHVWVGMGVGDGGDLGAGRRDSGTRRPSAHESAGLLHL